MTTLLNHSVVDVYYQSFCVVVDTETDLIGTVADVRSKILSSLVAQFGGQLKEGMIHLLSHF